MHLIQFNVEKYMSLLGVGKLLPVAFNLASNYIAYNLNGKF